MSVTLKFTYQPSKSLPEANKQINEFVELVKSQLLGVATKEELDGVQVEVEENIKESTKGFAGVRTKATDAESKVDMIANFNQATAQITLKAAMVNGIERSDITLSGDQILLNGDTTIGSGFKLSADRIQCQSLESLSTQIGGFSIKDGYLEAYLGEGFPAVRLRPSNIEFFKAGEGGHTYGYIVGGVFNGDDGLMISPNLSTGHLYADRVYGGEVRTSSQETTGGDDAGISATGYIRRKANGSSKRFKNSISYELTDDMNPEKLYDVSIVRFKYNKDYLSEKNDSRYDTPLIGMIAEDMDAHYPQACDYDEQGRPKGWNEHYIIPAMLKLIQDQHKEIEELKDAAVKRDSKIKELETQAAEVSELVKGLLQREE